MSSEVRLIARDPQASVLVQAPAGSGKTELLTQRILALLAIVEEPEEILALTFTRKAAAEMRGRVIEALRMDKPAANQSHKLETWQLAQQALKRSEERGWNLCDYPARLRLMTLDSLTFALAKQLPLLSGLGEMPRPGEYLFAAYREAAETALNQLLRSDLDTAEILLLHHDHQAPALIALVADMLSKREQWLPLIGRHAADMASARSEMEVLLGRLIVEEIRACDHMIPPEVRQKLPALIAYAANQPDCTLGIEDLTGLACWPAVDLDSVETWQGIARAVLKKTGGFPTARAINKARGFGTQAKDEKLRMQEMTEMMASVPGLDAALESLLKLPVSPVYDQKQWMVLEGLFTLLLFASQRLQQLFARSGEVDFTEIALRALQALEDEAGAPSDLLLKLDYRIHHILVDEFQDTSLLQMRLLQSLTAGWQEGDGRHRTLFMVGDPMQSIYRFRKAEVGLFLQAADNCSGLPCVEALQLERNFRSAPAIVDWVNRAFASILPEQQDVVRGAVAHAKATAALKHPGLVRLCIQAGKDVVAEAKAIVALICEQRQSPLDDGGRRRIAVLARSRKQLHAIMPQLEEAGVAYRAIKILPLHNRPEIRLLRALLRALLHPSDRVCWSALLRAPCCGLATVDMHLLMAGDKRPLWQLLNDESVIGKFDADALQRIEFLKQALTPCMHSSGKIAVRDLVATAWQRLAMPALIDQTALLNVEVALELIESLDEGGRINFQLFDERLEKLFAAPDVREEAAEVELMTMHGAKGLQWDTVILPGLGNRGQNSDRPLLAFTDIAVGDAVLPLMAAKAAVRSDDAIFSLVNGIEKSKYDYELARLLYVACTRAESELHMFGYVSESSEIAGSGSLLNLLMPNGIEAGCFGAALVTLDQEEGVEASEVKPVQRIKQLPVIAEPLPEVEVAVEAEYFWAGPEAAPVGNAVHAALQSLGERGVEQWSDKQHMKLNEAVGRLLLAEGLSGSLLEQAKQRAEAAIRKTLASQKGRWILSCEHSDAHCEWALSSERDGFVSHHIIDRSFIDSDGIRWIIDYKTAAHEGGDLDAFLDEEERRHAPQLGRYASILQTLEPGREIKTALYFPMLDVLKEVNLEP